MFGLPGVLNAPLFRNSRLYEYLSLRLAPRKPSQIVDYWQPYFAERLPALVKFARLQQARLILVLCPPLNRSFKDFQRNPMPEYRTLMELAALNGIDAIRLDEALIDRDYRELRLDPCCHFNAKGHEALADVFYKKTMEILAPVNTVP